MTEQIGADILNVDLSRLPWPYFEGMNETAARQKRGFRSAKIKVGEDIQADRVKAVREAVGPSFQLRIDANAAYDAEAAAA